MAIGGIPLYVIEVYTAANVLQSTVNPSNSAVAFGVANDAAGNTYTTGGDGAGTFVQQYSDQGVLQTSFPISDLVGTVGIAAFES